MIRTQVQWWYNRFKEDREDVNDNTHPGRPNSSTTDGNIEVVKKMILNNRRITIKQMADDVDISFGSCQAIFTNVLGMKYAAAKIASKLTLSTNKRCLDIAQEIDKVTNHDCMAMTLKPKANHSNGSV